jgi:excisionase family DNA binding protein
MRLNVKEAAARIGCSASLVYQLCMERAIPHVRVGGQGKRGKVLIEEADLESYLESCRVEPKVQGLRHISM